MTTSIGILGMGYWGPKWMEIFNKGNSRVRWVCDLDKEKLSYEDVCSTTDYREVLSDPGVDAVFVATPALTHYQIALESLLAGKDVLVEKPMATSVKEASELVRVAEKEGRVLMVSHTFLYNEAIRKMRQVIECGGVGKVSHIYSQRTNLGPAIMDVNVLWDIGPHDISIFRYLLGKEPDGISVKASAYLKMRPPRLAGTAFVDLHFPGDAIGDIHLSWFDFFKTRTVTVVGDTGIVACYDYASREKGRIQLQKFFIQGRKFCGEKLVVHEVDVSNTLENEANEFIRCVEKRVPPLTDGSEGLKVVKILQYGEASMNNNGRLERIKW